MPYEYLVASLPMLFPGDPPPFGSGEFLFRCQGVLTAGDQALLERAMAGRAEPADPEFVRDWAALETQMRNAVALARAAAWQADARPYLRDHPGFDDRARQIVSDAFSKPNPLERERALDRGIWNLLDDLARLDPFGMPAVLAFGLKLQRAERWAAWDEEAGRAELERRLEELMETAPPGRREDTP